MFVMISIFIIEISEIITDNNLFYYRALSNAKIDKRRKPNRKVVKSNNKYLKKTK